MKNMLLGFLMATCIFLMMGLKDASGVNRIENGLYQAFESTDEQGNSVTLMINTQTGQLYGLDKYVEYLMDRPWKQYCAQVDNGNWGRGIPKNCSIMMDKIYHD